MNDADVDNSDEPLSAEVVRLQLFYVWCGIFALYVCTFLLSTVKEGVTFPLAIDAVWKVAYLIVPVLGAFAGFWFGPHSQQPAHEITVVDPNRRRVMFVLTALLHGFVYLIIIFGVLVVDFADQEAPVSYPHRVDTVIRFMLLIWSVSLLPVGWLLEGAKIPTAEMPQTE